jgi:hypothetical protein
MRQHGCLDYAYGVWLLVTEREDDPVRFWENKPAAHAELAEEGWADRAFSPALGLRSDLWSYPVHAMRGARMARGPLQRAQESRS